MKQLLLVFSLILLFLSSAAQESTCNYTLSGVLSDKQTGERLAFATIYVIELQSGVVTDDSGSFSIRNLCNGPFTLKIEHIGCHTLIRKVQINNADVNLKIELDHSAHELGEVEIAAHREEKPTGRTREVMEGLALKKYQGDNLGNMLSNLTGVNVIQTGANIAKPVIHGMHSNRVLLLNNGIRQEGQQWGAEHAPEIDPFIAKKLTVIKGAGTIKYGADAIAGVILVEPGDLPDTTGITGELNLVGALNGRMINSSGLVEGNLKEVPNLKFRIQGTLRRSGNQHTPEYFLSNTGVSEKNYSAALAYGYKNLQSEIFFSHFSTAIGIFTGSHLGNTTDLVQTFTGSAKPINTSFSYKIDRPFQEITHELLKVKTKLTLKNFNTISLVYSRQFNQRFEYDRHGPKNDSLAALDRPEFQYFITTHLLDTEYQLHHHNNFEGSMGISGMLQANTYNGRQFIPNFRNQGIGAYWIESYHKGPWRFEAGLRADHRFLQVFKAENGIVVSPKFNYTNTSASFGANYQLNEKLLISLFSGTAWRPPAVNELFSNGLHHGSATIEIGNSKLKPESNWNNSISASYKSEAFSGELSLYHNSLTGFINLVPSGQTALTIRGAFPSYVYIQQNAIFKGVDASFRAKINSKLSLISQLSIVRATERNTRNYLSQIPSDKLKTGLEREFSLGKLNQRVIVSVNGTYVAQQTRYAEQLVITQENGIQLEIKDFAPPPADYFLLEADITANVKVGKQLVFISISCSNLLNRKYRSYMNRFRYFSDDIGRNIQLKLNIPLTIKKH